MSGSRELKEILARLRRGWRGGASIQPQPVDLRPTSAFEALLDQRLASLEARMEELRSRLNGIVYLVLGAVTVQVVLRVAGF